MEAIFYVYLLVPQETSGAPWQYVRSMMRYVQYSTGSTVCSGSDVVPPFVCNVQRSTRGSYYRYGTTLYLFMNVPRLTLAYQYCVLLYNGLWCTVYRMILRYYHTLARYRQYHTPPRGGEAIIRVPHRKLQRVRDVPVPSTKYCTTLCQDGGESSKVARTLFVFFRVSKLQLER